MRIGIFGGSFNPVHKGHLKLAQTAFSELNLDKVFFVPSYQTPLKENTESLLPTQTRIDLLKKAIRPYPYFSVSSCEIRRKGLSFTVDTLKFFKTKFKNKAVLYFLAGADTLTNLKRWKSVDEIKKLCRFVIASRPGYPLKTPSWTLSLPMDSLKLSSTEIRKSKNKSKNKLKSI